MRRIIYFIEINFFFSLSRKDIDECRTTSHGCEQICNNLAGSFECLCHHGLQIDPANNKKCIGMCERIYKLNIKRTHICIIANIFPKLNTCLLFPLSSRESMRERESSSTTDINFVTHSISIILSSLFLLFFKRSTCNSNSYSFLTLTPSHFSHILKINYFSNHAICVIATCVREREMNRCDRQENELVSVKRRCMRFS